MKKYKTIALGALIATGFASCELTEKPTSYKGGKTKRVNMWSA